jgi:hypothetical protein
MPISISFPLAPHFSENSDFGYRAASGPVSLQATSSRIEIVPADAVPGNDHNDQRQVRAACVFFAFTLQTFPH